MLEKNIEKELFEKSLEDKISRESVEKLYECLKNRGYEDDEIKIFNSFLSSYVEYMRDTFSLKDDYIFDGICNLFSDEKVAETIKKIVRKYLAEKNKEDRDREYKTLVINIVDVGIAPHNKEYRSYIGKICSEFVDPSLERSDIKIEIINSIFCGIVNLIKYGEIKKEDRERTLDNLLEDLKNENVLKFLFEKCGEKVAYNVIETGGVVAKYGKGVFTKFCESLEKGEYTSKDIENLLSLFDGFGLLKHKNKDYIDKMCDTLSDKKIAKTIKKYLDYKDEGDPEIIIPLNVLYFGAYFSREYAARVCGIIDKSDIGKEFAVEIARELLGYTELLRQEGMDNAEITKNLYEMIELFENDSVLKFLQIVYENRGRIRIFVEG
ncbi:MAG: hypothetical protein QXS69_03740 [Candidatus Aenigmatarchaeota archaeon]